ncbi:1-acyl-sn-glycerol-3-phosphate acyltransferase [Acidithiobacillus sp. MC6.1]|nr:1-acyl-sn-glycerol-3-phosphate acyltransferase [Acidithiobacillus sp. MC6.1]
MLILVRPHTSLLDGPRVAWLLYRRGFRHCIFPVDPHYARHPFWRPVLQAYGWLCGRAEMLAMDTHSPFAMRELGRLLQLGRTVVIFPQGTGLRDPSRPEHTGWKWLTARCPGVDIQELSLS